MTDEELYQFLFSMFMDGYLDYDSGDWNEETPDDVYYQFISFCESVASAQFDKHFLKARDDYSNIPLIKALG